MLVLLYKAIEGLAQHFERDIRHAGQIRVELQPRLDRQLARPAGDPRRLVAHPLKIVARLHADHDHAKFRGHRAAQRHVTDGFVVDLDLQLVELVVRRDHPVGERDVAVNERLYRQARLIDGAFAHLQQVGAEIFKLGVEETFHGRCGRMIS